MAVSEDDFWADDGLHDQIDERVAAYINEHRKVIAPPEIDWGKMSMDEIDAATKPVAGEYRNYLSYSAYYNEDGEYCDNLDQVAVEGKVQFIEECAGHNEMGFAFGNIPYDTRKRYVSPVMENPTWLEVALLANDMINCTGDNHHIYLEDIRPSEKLFSIDKDSFVKIYRFSMGS